MRYDDYLVQCTLRGITRVYGRPAAQVPPMTIDILLKLRHVLFVRPNEAPKLRSVEDLSWWTTALLLFFSLLRSCHVIPDAIAEGRNPHNEYILRRSSLSLVNGRITLAVHRTKTIQFHERVLRIPLPILRNHILCPTTMPNCYLRGQSVRPASEHLIGVVRGTEWIPLTYEARIQQAP